MFHHDVYALKYWLQQAQAVKRQVTLTHECVDPEIAANVSMSFGDSLLPRVPILEKHLHLEAPSTVEAEMMGEVIIRGRCHLAP